jgi:hypothetical protein
MAAIMTVRSRNDLHSHKPLAVTSDQRSHADDGEERPTLQFKA